VPGISKWVPGVSHLVLHLSRHPVATVPTWLGIQIYLYVY